MLDLSKPILRIEKKEIAGGVVYIRHLSIPVLEDFATRGQSDEDEKQVMYSLINTAICDEDGKGVKYSDKQLIAQPFSLIRELCEMIMQVNSPTEKKS